MSDRTSDVISTVIARAFIGPTVILLIRGIDAAASWPFEFGSVWNAALLCGILTAVGALAGYHDAEKFVVKHKELTPPYGLG